MVRAISRLSRVSITALAASAFAIPAAASSVDYFLKIPPIEGDTGERAQTQQIEIVSWSWGPADAAAHARGGGHGAGKVSLGMVPSEGNRLKQDSLTIKQSGVAFDPEAYRAKDRLRNAGPVNGHASAPAPGEAEITLKGNAGTGGAGTKSHRPSDITLKRGTTAGEVRVAVGDVHGDGTAEDAGAAALNRTRQKELLMFAAPLKRGRVELSIKSPWGGCRVGARYSELQLGGGGKSYTLRNAQVTACEAAAEGQPTETMSINYEEIF